MKIYIVLITELLVKYIPYIQLSKYSMDVEYLSHKKIVCVSALIQYVQNNTKRKRNVDT